MFRNQEGRTSFFFLALGIFDDKKKMLASFIYPFQLIEERKREIETEDLKENGREASTSHLTLWKEDKRCLRAKHLRDH